MAAPLAAEGAACELLTGAWLSRLLGANPLMTIFAIHYPRLDVRKQRREKLKEYSKLVARWSELTVQEHEWYLAHQGGLVGKLVDTQWL